MYMYIRISSHLPTYASCVSPSTHWQSFWSWRSGSYIICIRVLMICRYRWLCYINPNYYGFSASAVILLSDFESDCERDGGSELECYAVSANYILDTFDFNDVNPYENTLVSTLPTHWIPIDTCQASRVLYACVYQCYGVSHFT